MKNPIQRRFPFIFSQMKHISQRRTPLKKIHAKSLADRLKSDFTPAVRKRGEDYAARGRVKIISCSGEQAMAVVTGTRDYHVYLFSSRKTTDCSVFCTCPYFEAGNMCKHIWAALRTIEYALPESEYAPGNGTNSKNDPEGGETGWENMFSDSFWKSDIGTPPWKHDSHNFLICYELDITPGGAEISVVERYRRKDGALGRKRKLQASTVEHRGLPKTDQTIIAILDNVAHREPQGYRSTFPLYVKNMERFRLESRDMDLLLPLLAETGRCMVRHHSKGIVASPLKLEDPMDAGLLFEVEHLAEKDTLNILPRIVFPTAGDPEPLGSISLFFHTTPLFLIRQEHLYRLKGPTVSWVKTVIDSGAPEVPARDIKKLYARIMTLPGKPEIRLPEPLLPKKISDVRPTPLLVLDLSGDTVTGTLFLEYEGFEIDWSDPRQSIMDVDKWTQVERNPAAEEDMVQTLVCSGFREEKRLFQVESANAAPAITSLVEKGWRVEGEGRRPVRGGRVLKMTVSSGIDWFDLEGEISFGSESISLPRAVRAFLRGSRTIRLGDGSIGLLPQQWLARNLSYLETGVKAGRNPEDTEKIRFAASQALLLDSLLIDNKVEYRDNGFPELRDRLKSFSGIEKIPTSAAFRGTLRPYQQDALGWFSFLRKFGLGGILADDMGLGKTVQILAWLQHVSLEKKASGPSLVVAPTSVLFNWQEGAERFVPSLKIISYTGTGRTALIRHFSSADLVVTSYGLLRRDITRLMDTEFEYVILDESQTIKNPDSQTAKAVRLLKAGHRLCLTGTPLENRLTELWSQMEFLNPGMLGTRTHFERRFVRPVSQGDREQLEFLKRIVRPFILRRTKKNVAEDLPEKAENIIRCSMTTEQAKVYARIRDYYRNSILVTIARNGAGKSRMKVLEGLLRLRQAANHPALIGDKARSGKLEKLMLLIEEIVAGGHKALIFSQFTSMLSIIRKAVQSAGISYEYLDGSTPQSRRAFKVHNFQHNREISLFLISLKAGGLGLNLTAADYVFLVDPWWNPAVELQAVDRTHRIGQEKKVFTYRFITCDTVEEKVLHLQRRKQELFQSITSGGENMLAKLAREDLEVLLS